jgi:hypothetical protein
MRRGWLSERMVKCSKAGCPCGEDPEARHGPYFSLTRPVQGKTHSRFLTPEQAVVARQQIEAGRAFRAALEKYCEDCEDWLGECSCALLSGGRSRYSTMTYRDLASEISWCRSLAFSRYCLWALPGSEAGSSRHPLLKSNRSDRSGCILSLYSSTGQS